MVSTSSVDLPLPLPEARSVVPHEAGTFRAGDSETKRRSEPCRKRISHVTPRLLFSYPLETLGMRRDTPHYPFSFPYSLTVRPPVALQPWQPWSP